MLVKTPSTVQIAEYGGWRGGDGNCVRHINEVKLRRARLALRLVTIFGGSTVQVLIPATQPCHPSVGRCSEYRRWFRPSLGRNGAADVTTLWRFINLFININMKYLSVGPTCCFSRGRNFIENCGAVFGFRDPILFTKKSWKRHQNRPTCYSPTLWCTESALDSSE